MAAGNPTRVQGLTFSLGSALQPAYNSLSATFNTWRKLNAEVPFLDAHTETDAKEVGKGNDFITAVYNTYIEPAPQRIEKYGSAEFTAWAWAYAMGVCTLATSVYTIHAIDPGTTLQPPYFTLAAMLPAGGATAFDEASIGCCIESVETTFKYGPGRASVRTVVEYMGLGLWLIPSTVTYPAVLTENYMYSSSAVTITINGVDYISNQMALEGTFTWKNNLIAALRYFPGSGSDTNKFQVGGRLFAGERVPGFTFTVFLDNNSTEYALLVAQTSGTAVVKLEFDATHYVQWSYPLVTFEKVERKAEEGLVAVMVTVAPHYDDTIVGGLANGVLVVTSENDITDIAQ